MSISFDRAAESFDRTRSPPDHVMDKIVETLQKELEDYKRILDVAVGTGKFAKPLQNAGFEVVGVDISKRMLAKAREKGTRDLVASDACTLPFPDSAFDASMSISTLHLITDWKLALREIIRVTKDSLFTILQEGLDYKATPNGVYKELLKKYGYSYDHPGKGLWKLQEIIKPTRSIFATSYETNINERIGFLSEKAFSYQWNAPENLHKKAMQELRKIFAGKKTYTTDVYVHKWEISGIQDHLGK